ncbi:MAG: WD40 repeat domain-containing protein, partial [Planctomycetota bacterium]
AVIRWDSDIWSLRSDPRFWDVVPRPRNARRSDESSGARTQSTGWAFRSSGVPPVLIPSNSAEVEPLIASAAGDGSLDLLLATTGETLRSTPSAASPVAAMSASSTGDTLAVLHANGELALIDPRSGSVLSRSKAAPAESSGHRVSQLSFAANGKKIIAWSHGRRFLWTSEGALLVEDEANRALDGWVPCDLAASEWMPRALGTTLYLHSLTDTEAPTRRIEFDRRITGLAVDPEGSRVAVGTDYGGVYVLDLGSGATLWRSTMTDDATGKTIGTFGDPLRVATLTFSEDSAYLAVCMTPEFFVGVYDSARGEQVWRTGLLGGRMGAPMALAFQGSFLIGDEGGFAWLRESGRGTLSGAGTFPNKRSRAFSMTGEDILFDSGKEIRRRHLLGGSIRWRTARRFRDPEWIEHPSGWVAGSFDPAKRPVSARRFDPKRLRAAASGVRLLPPPE